MARPARARFERGGLQPMRAHANSEYLVGTRQQPRKVGVVPTSAQRRLCRPQDCADLASKSRNSLVERGRQVGTITCDDEDPPSRLARVAAPERAGGQQRAPFGLHTGQTSLGRAPSQPLSLLPPLPLHLRTGEERHQPERLLSCDGEHVLKSASAPRSRGGRFSVVLATASLGIWAVFNQER